MTAEAPRHETFKELRLYRQAFMLLLAFLLYNDGIQTIIRMATTHASTEIGIDETVMLWRAARRRSSSIPSAFIFGSSRNKIGAKTAVFAGLAAHAVITLLAYFMHNACSSSRLR